LNVQKYQNNEAQLFYLRGWSEGVPVKDVNAKFLSQALNFIVDDVVSLELILMKLALQEAILGQKSQLILERFNRTLNIQWAIDIENSIRKN
jgi:hypothetical protein